MKLQINTLFRRFFPSTKKIVSYSSYAASLIVTTVLSFAVVVFLFYYETQNNRTEDIVESQNVSVSAPEEMLSPTTTIFNTATNEDWIFPLQSGALVTLDQGYFGEFSHEGKHALDFQGEGLEIRASKSGVVKTILQGGKWDIWCNSNEQCFELGEIWRGNHVIIAHGDGIESHYFHMQPGSIPTVLQEGSIVKQGDVLGLIGITGFTCDLTSDNCARPDPHLHFDVRQNGETIPTMFKDCELTFNVCENGVPVAFRFYRVL